MRRLAECALAYQRGVGAWAREVSRLPLHGTHWGFRIQLRAFGWAWREILQYGCHTLRGQDSVPLRTEQRRRNGFRKEQDPCMGGSAARRNGVRCHDLGHRLACFDGPPRPPAISHACDRGSPSSSSRATPTSTKRRGCSHRHSSGSSGITFSTASCSLPDLRSATAAVEICSEAGCCSARSPPDATPACGGP